jgi:hypothetical protein
MRRMVGETWHTMLEELGGRRRAENEKQDGLGGGLSKSFLMMREGGLEERRKCGW